MTGKQANKEERIKRLLDTFRHFSTSEESMVVIQEVASLGHKGAMGYVASALSQTMAAKQRGFDALRSEAERGCIWSMYWHGKLLTDSFVPQLVDAGLVFLRSAAEKGHMQAAFNAGCIYEERPEQQNFDNAFKYYTLSANGDYGPASRSLGICYEVGRGVKVDQVRALQLFERAAAAGEPLGLKEMGSIYMDGRLGLKADGSRASAFFLQSASMGCIEGMHGLYQCTVDFANTQEDAERAFAVMTERSANGETMAQLLLAGLYMAGHGKERNADIAADICLALGDVGDQFLTTLSEDVVAAGRKRKAAGKVTFPWEAGFQTEDMKLSSTLDVLSSMAEKTVATASQLEGILSRLDELSLGSKADLKEKRKRTVKKILARLDAMAGMKEIDLAKVIETGSMKELEEAASLGHAPAMCKLGRILEAGDGVPKNEAKAAELYEQAMLQGSVEGRFFLGVCYEMGTGVEKNEKKAVALYEAGVKDGDVNSMNNLGVCYEEGIGVAVDAKKAVELYLLAGKDGDGDAKFNLAECYENGVGVEKDLAKALSLYNEAAAKGNQDAKTKVAEMQKL